MWTTNHARADDYDKHIFDPFRVAGAVPIPEVGYQPVARAKILSEINLPQ